jgi:hypothetical protein
MRLRVRLEEGRYPPVTVAFADTIEEARRIALTTMVSASRPCATVITTDDYHEIERRSTEALWEAP